MYDQVGWGINNSHKVKQLPRISISPADSDDVWNICVDNGGPQSARMQYAWLPWFTTFHSGWWWSPRIRPLWKAYVAILRRYWSVIIFYQALNKSWWPQRFWQIEFANWIFSAAHQVGRGPRSRDAHTRPHSNFTYVIFITHICILRNYGISFVELTNV
jgi:hypothetical protein